MIPELKICREHEVELCYAVEDSLDECPACRAEREKEINKEALNKFTYLITEVKRLCSKSSFKEAFSYDQEVLTKMVEELK